MCLMLNKDLLFQLGFPVSTGQKGLKIELEAYALMIIFNDMVKILISHLLFYIE